MISVPKYRKTRIKDVFTDINMAGLMLFTVFGFTIFFSQGWKNSIYIIAIPVILLIFSIYFRLIMLFKKNLSIEGIPLEQYPFGDERYIFSVFKFGFILSMILLITFGYESKLSGPHLGLLFNLFIFFFSCIYILCFHVALNKAWLSARIELDFFKTKQGSFLFDDKESLAEFNFTRTRVKYTLWTPTQVRLERFSIINILMFLSLAGATFFDLISKNRFNIIPLQLPGNESNEFYLSLMNIVIMVVEPLFYIFMARKLYHDVFNYDIDKLAQVLVKIELDDILREKIILFLEKIQTYRMLRANNWQG
ncbi:MAG: hypothetical protein ACTSXP_14685 [Promethearchaeota archaeon]